MPRHLASRDTTARESQTYRQQPRTSTDPAPRCPIGSSTKTCPRRFGSLETAGQKLNIKTGDATEPKAKEDPR
eukprot:7135093-Pyramimonas_sp.AAC.1